MRLWLGLAVVLAAGLPSARACIYCRMGGDPAVYHAQMKVDLTGEGRMDAAVDQFAPPPVNPPPLAIVTRAADLPVAAARRAPAPAVAAVAVKRLAAAPAAGGTRAVDGALAGLALIGGIFCWRTRQAPRGLS